MRFGLGSRKVIGWMALCAVLIGIFAPAISHALAVATGTGERWAEVCSASGFKALGRELPGQPVSPSGVMGDHCPFCALQSHAIAPPPASLTALPHVLARFEQPDVYLPVRRARSLWLAAQARAPPIAL